MFLISSLSTTQLLLRIVLWNSIKIIKNSRNSSQHLKILVMNILLRENKSSQQTAAYVLCMWTLMFNATPSFKCLSAKRVHRAIRTCFFITCTCLDVTDGISFKIKLLSLLLLFFFFFENHKFLSVLLRLSKCNILCICRILYFSCFLQRASIWIPTFITKAFGICFRTVAKCGTWKGRSINCCRKFWER